MECYHSNRSSLVHCFGPWENLLVVPREVDCRGLKRELPRIRVRSSLTERAAGAGNKEGAFLPGSEGAGPAFHEEA